MGSWRTMPLLFKNFVRALELSSSMASLTVHQCSVVRCTESALSTRGETSGGMLCGPRRRFRDGSPFESAGRLCARTPSSEVGACALGELASPGRANFLFDFSTRHSSAI